MHEINGGEWLWNRIEWIPNEGPQAPVAATPMPGPAIAPLNGLESW